MSLFEQVEFCVLAGFELSFTSAPMNLVIKLKKKSFEKEAWLPLFDHFYESRIVDAISFMVSEIQKASDPHN